MPLAARLVRLRFRWYAAATAKSLARQWQGLSFAVLLFPLGIPLLVIPFLGILSQKHGMGWNFVYVIAIELVGILWILPQRRNLSGGKFMHYVTALPLPGGVCRVVDSALLIVADGILFVPFFVTMAVLPDTANGFSYGLNVALIFTLMAMVFAAQYALVEKLTMACPLILIADVLFCVALTMSSITAASWLVAGTLLCSGFTLFLRRESIVGKRVSLYAAGLSAFLTRKLSREILARMPVLLRIRVKTLSAAWGMTGMRLLCGFLIVVGADYLISSFHYDSRSLPAATITMAVTALVLAGLYRTLQQARAGMHDYLAALPLRRHRTILNDVSIVLLLGLLPLAVLVGPMVVNNVGSAVVIAVLVVAFLVLLAFLRWPTLSGGRWAVLLGIVTASCWSGAVMAAVH